MQLSKGLMSRLATAIARVKRTGNKVKTGAVVSRPVVKATLSMKESCTVEGGSFGRVFFRQVTFTGPQASFKAARAQEARREAVLRAEERTSPVIFRVPASPEDILGKWATRMGPALRGDALKAHKAKMSKAVKKQAVRVAPVAKMNNAPKKEVVKRVKKNVPAVMVRKQVVQAAKAAAVIVAVREIVAMKETAKAALSTAKGESLKAAKAVLAEIKGLLGMALQTARAISREVAV